jgi:hypothetical protein
VKAIIIEERDNGWEVRDMGVGGQRCVFQRREENAIEEAGVRVQITRFLEELFNEAQTERQEEKRRKARSHRPLDR